MDFICCCNDTAIYKNRIVQNLATNSLERKQLKDQYFKLHISKGKTFYADKLPIDIVIVEIFFAVESGIFSYLSY